MALRDAAAGDRHGACHHSVAVGDDVAMKILVACEFSGVVREAFRVKGHQAISCDLLPTEQPGAHIQGDILELLQEGWDMLLAFPPCTYLAVSGARWTASNPARQAAQKEALQFVQTLLDAPIGKICLENPVGAISTHIRKPDQYIQPYQFGVNRSKKTGLWLKNLPLLIPTKEVPPDHYCNGLPRWANQGPSGADTTSPSKDRGLIRSRFDPEIARAMADQWG